MFGFKKKKKTEENGKEVKLNAENEITEADELKEEITVEIKEETPEDSEGVKDDKNSVLRLSGKSKKTVDEEIEDEMPDLAAILNKTESGLKKEFYIYEIRKLMKFLCKIIVKHNITEPELEQVFVSSAAVNIDEVLVSPVFLDTCRAIINRREVGELKVGALIDFPFGESTFKAKMADIKESAKFGVDDITVVVPTALMSLNKTAKLRRQIFKVSRAYSRPIGIAVNADMADSQIKKVLKLTENSRIKFVILITGNLKGKLLNDKIVETYKNKGGLKLSVLGNIETVEEVSNLIKLGVYKIYTPFADNIGDALSKKFKVKL